MIALRRQLLKLRTLASVMALLALDSVGGGQVLRAAVHSAGATALPAAWHVVETLNFRILSYGTEGVSQETAKACEALRERLAEQWLGGADKAPTWMPKCDIVLHASDDAYVREVGSGGRVTVASSLIDRKQGRIAIRRIDIKPSQPHWQIGALGHELTHVVLADRFAGQSLPRWIDEGMATLADPADKQGRYMLDLKNAIASRAEFRVCELIALADYPPAQRWGTFYGQSTSLVQFLVAQGGEERFLEFVELSIEQGYEPALHQIYRFGVAELERRWQTHLKASSAVAAVAHSRSAPPAALLPTAAAVSAQAVSLKASQRPARKFDR